MSYKLDKPYTDKQRADFIVKYNHNQGLNIQETEIALYALEPWEILQGDEVIDNTEQYQQEQTEKEKARIAMLNLTGADVERGIYKAKSMDFDDIISYIEALPLSEEGQPQVDIKALKIELKANNFYRGNPYVQQIGTLLGFTSEQLDKFFETGDYKELLPKFTLEIKAIPEDSLVIINGEEITTITETYGTNIEYSVSKEGYITQSNNITLLKDEIININLEPEEPTTEA